MENENNNNLKEWLIQKEEFSADELNLMDEDIKCIINKKQSHTRIFVDDVDRSDLSLDKNINNRHILILVFELALHSFPISISLLSIFLLETINIIYIGQLNDPTLLASIGLGTTFYSVFGAMPTLGIQGAIDTLCSSSFGAKEYKLVGIYTSVSRIITFIYFLIVFIPLTFFSKYVFLLLGQNEYSASLSSSFVFAMIPSLFFVGQREILTRYLQSMLIFKPQMIITLLTLLLHPLWANIFINRLDLKLIGAAYSLLITQMLNFVLLIGYIKFSSNINKETISIVNKDTFRLNNVKRFLSLAIPSVVLGIVESLSFEFIIILSSFIGELEMSASICLFNFGAIIFFFILGISNTTSSYIGNCIGEGDHKSAKRYILSAMIYTSFLSLTFVILIYLLRLKIALLYTNNGDIIHIFLNIIPYYITFLSFDILGITLGGIIRGLGRQKQAAKIFLFVMYLIGFPLSLLLTFTLHQGVIGLWRAQVVNVMLIFFLFGYILNSKSIEDTVDRYKKEIEIHKKQS